MLLSIYKAGKMWNEGSGIKGLDLVKILIQDQILYFLLYVLLICPYAVWHDLSKGSFSALLLT